MLGQQSAKRTDDNSPAIHRWVTSTKRLFQSAKRTAEVVRSYQRATEILSPASRAPGYLLFLFPSTKVLGYYRSFASRTINQIRRKGTASRALVIVSLSVVSGCARPHASTPKPLKPPEQLTETRALPEKSSAQLKLAIDGALEQVGRTTSYDNSYQKIEYPNGDVPIETGVCSDVIVRAFRKAGIDLQKDIHEDMKDNFAAYPTKWGASGTDTNIDHRRVPNLQTYFTRKRKSPPITDSSENFIPGDIVTWDLGGGVDHVGIVINAWYKPSQRYLIVHNIGGGTRMEDVLFAWKVTGHYRYF